VTVLSRPATRLQMLTLAVTFLAVVAIFAWWANHRANMTDAHNRKVDTSLCLALSGKPEHPLTHHEQVLLDQLRATFCHH
jgi:hypothetical protein